MDEARHTCITMDGDHRALRCNPLLACLRAGTGARMDPEDLREVISAYQKCVAETLQRFGGFVAKYMGDGVLTPVCARNRMI